MNFEVSVKGVLVLQTDDERLASACREYYQCLFPNDEVSLIRKEYVKL